MYPLERHPQFDAARAEYIKQFSISYTLLSFVVGGFYFQPSDEDLSRHTSEQSSLAGTPCRSAPVERKATRRYGFGVKQLENRSNAGRASIQPVQTPRLSKVLGVYTRIAIATVASLPVN